MLRRHMIHGLAASALAAAAPWVRAQAKYPARPITLVVPFAAGGGGDTTARLLAKGLADRLDGSVVVDNRAGASGNIGAAYVMRAVPDGYTLLSLSSTYGIQAAVGKPGFDAVNDMQPIIMATRDPLILLVHPSAPWRSARELAVAAQKAPGTISHGSAGAGSIAHLGMEELGFAMGASFLHVPYKGSSAAMTDLLGGNVQLVLTTTTFAGPYVKSGKVRALGLAGAKRLAALPAVPTFDEQGYAYDVFDWKAVAGPRGMPPEVVQRLNRALNDVLSSAEVSTRFEADGSAVVGGAPEVLTQALKADIERWKVLVRKASIRLE
ncbi:tripartite tricarboxylate transporter substrate binding protein [uncultured Pseudacidovorax sp.]|uniref:tripartite tricarboxylate transporter substrate binding protein n=1 Tax=uncultured Pseudacidovorax sp. TaxID=679313 RepID=UPI0025FA69DF|nr:tripartite tricarboxylate transporter substrate binding protein [uncultured Pseudacidovorax sp.]